MPIQVSPFAVEDWIVPRGDVHPFIKMMAKNQERNEKRSHDGEEHGEVFQLTSHHNRPLRVGDMMHNEPEKAACQECEEIGKSKEPRKTKLMPVNEGSDDAQSETEQRDHCQQ